MSVSGEFAMDFYHAVGCFLIAGFGQTLCTGGLENALLFFIENGYVTSIRDHRPSKTYVVWYVPNQVSYGTKKDMESYTSKRWSHIQAPSAYLP